MSGEIRSRNSKIDRQCNGQQKKTTRKTSNGLNSTSITTKDRTTRITIKTGGEPEFSIYLVEYE